MVSGMSGRAIKNQSDDDLLRAVRSVLESEFSMPDLDTRWETVRAEFLTWLHGLPASISGLSRNLYLLELLCQQFDPVRLRSSQRLLGTLLEGTLDVGDAVSLRGKDYLVVRREVSGSFGLRYLLASKDGEMIEHEFFE